MFEDAQGRAWHQEAMIIPSYGSPAEIPGPEDPRTERFPRVAHEIRYVPGTRRAQSPRSRWSAGRASAG